MTTHPLAGLQMGPKSFSYLVVGVFQLAVVDPAVQEVEYGVRHQAEDVLNQRPHLRVTRFAIRVDR